MPDVLVRARGLTKRFGDFTAVDGIDFELHQGEAFGFLGPNGAGKSSTMRMISCVSPPTDGELTIFGRDPRREGPQIRARLGVVPQEDTLDVELTVRENLLVYGRYFGLPRAIIRERAAQLLEFVQLADRADDMVEPLSGGMKRRLTIARSLINDPEILILDEPTTGLDPQARHVVWDRLFRLKQRGVTLILTTHYMDEAEQLCDRLVVMDHAKIAAEGTPRDLLARYTTPEVLELRFAPDLEEEAIRKIKEFDTERLRESSPLRTRAGSAGGEYPLMAGASGAEGASPGSSPLMTGAGGAGGSSPLMTGAGGAGGSSPLMTEVGGAGGSSPLMTEFLADRVLLYVADGDAALAQVAALGVPPLTSLVRRSTLEDVFLRLTGRRLEE